MLNVTRINTLFAHQKAFVGYLTAGDGGIKRSLAMAEAMIAGGINLLEIGVPFSDAIADGPVIQRAAKRALAEGTTLKDILWLVNALRQKTDIPLILFSYLNPILAVLKTSFFQDAKHAGVDGILIVDCPIEEATLIHDKCLNAALAPIYIISPSTPIERFRQIADYGKGFLYYACQKGTTGARSFLPDDFATKMQSIKSHVNLPVIAGFGISNRDTANQVLQHADGVVIGSLFVKAIEEGCSSQALTDLVLSINPLEKRVLI